MTHTKLKPCPLCGRETDDPMEITDSLAGCGYWSIGCFECGIELQAHFIMPPHMCNDRRRMLSLGVRRWNRRPK